MIKGVLLGDEGRGVLKIYRGKRALMVSPLAFSIKEQITNNFPSTPLNPNPTLSLSPSLSPIPAPTPPTPSSPATLPRTPSATTSTSPSPNAARPPRHKQHLLHPLAPLPRSSLVGTPAMASDGFSISRPTSAMGHSIPRPTSAMSIASISVSGSTYSNPSATSNSGSRSGLVGKIVHNTSRSRVLSLIPLWLTLRYFLISPMVM